MLVLPSEPGDPEAIGVGVEAEMPANEQSRPLAVGKPCQPHCRQPLGITELLAGDDEELPRAVTARLPRVGKGDGRFGKESAGRDRQRCDALRPHPVGIRGLLGRFARAEDQDHRYQDPSRGCQCRLRLDVHGRSLAARMKAAARTSFPDYLRTVGDGG